MNANPAVRNGSVAALVSIVGFLACASSSAARQTDAEGTPILCNALEARRTMVDSLFSIADRLDGLIEAVPPADAEYLKREQDALMTLMFVGDTVAFAARSDLLEAQRFHRPWLIHDAIRSFKSSVNVGVDEYSDDLRDFVLAAAEGLSLLPSLQTHLGATWKRSGDDIHPSSPTISG